MKKKADVGKPSSITLNYDKEHHHKRFFFFNGKKVKEPPILRKQKLTNKQKAADAIAYWGGSWTFIVTLTVLLIIWMFINTMFAIFGKWDPYPFILMNLFLSCLSAFQAPIILMAQNRETERDRMDAKYDYLVNRKAEREIQDMQKDLEQIKTMLRGVRRRL